MASFKAGSSKGMRSLRPRKFRKRITNPFPTLPSTPPAEVVQPPIPAAVPAPENVVVESKAEVQESVSPPVAPAKEAETELSEINRMIQQASAKLSQIDDTESDSPLADQAQTAEESVADDPSEFNGLSGEDEKIELVEAELDRERRRAAQLKHQLEMIEAEFKKEKGHMDREVHELKKEMHRTAPIADSKFFSLSRQLREAVDAIHTLQKELDTPLAGSSTGMISSMVSTQPAAETFTPTLAPATAPPQPTAPQAPLPAPATTPPPTVVPKEPVMEKKDEPDPKLKKKKLMITGGAAVAALLVVSTGLSMQLSKPPTVNQKLVEKTLGEVKGAQTQNPTAEIPNRAQAQADVSFEASTWETATEPIIGVKVDYPSNAVNIIKTDSSLTFIRKTGYIFKVQKIETGLDLADYWKQIQATSLEYTVSEVTVKGKKALSLVLNDTTDYPGNRYLIKGDKYILDVWYAIKSDRFSDDDVKRASKMLDSLQITL